MNSITNVLLDNLKGESIKKISTNTGIEASKINSFLKIGVPLILKGLNNNYQNPQQAKDIFGALKKDHNGNILKEVLNAVNAKDKQVEGEKIINKVFGNNQNNLFKVLARQTGLQNSQNSQNILGTLAPLVLGYLGKNLNSKEYSRNKFGNFLNTMTKKSTNPQVNNIFNDVLNGNKEIEVSQKNVQSNPDLKIGANDRITKTNKSGFGFLKGCLWGCFILFLISLLAMYLFGKFASGMLSNLDVDFDQEPEVLRQNIQKQLEERLSTKLDTPQNQQVNINTPQITEPTIENVTNNDKPVKNNVVEVQEETIENFNLPAFFEEIKGDRTIFKQKFINNRVKLQGTINTVIRHPVNPAFIATPQGFEDTNVFVRCGQLTSEKVTYKAGDVVTFIGNIKDEQKDGIMLEDCKITN